MEEFVSNLNWEMVVGIVLSLIGSTSFLGWKVRALNKVLKEAQEFVNHIDIATRPDSEGGDKITIAEGKRIAYEGKDVILALQQLFAKTNVKT
jgi:hypothetical protein